MTPVIFFYFVLKKSSYENKEGELCVGLKITNAFFKNNIRKKGEDVRSHRQMRREITAG